MTQKVGAREWTAQTLYGLARIAATQGDAAAGRRQGEESLAIYQIIGHRKTVEVKEWLQTLGPSEMESAKIPGS